MNAVEVASLFGTLDLRDNFSGPLGAADRQFAGFGERLQSLGGGLTNIGGQLTAFAAPAAALFGVAINQSVDFNEELTNVQAVLGLTAEETQVLGDKLLAIGASSRAGPQATIRAFYDIAGSVADASTHMAVLDSAIAASEAGNADLGVTTSALTAIMNGYGFSAEQAAYASDVMTRTVGVGVGTMDELGPAMASVAGLAASLGIDFADLGAEMAFLSTKNNSFSQSGTQLRAMMVALLNPNERMRQALQEAGLASGQAAIQQLGLVGAYQALAAQSPTFQDNMAGAVGSVEALNGVIGLSGDGAIQALEAFGDGLDGATAAARAIQNLSDAATLDQVKSAISALGIEVGNALAPALADLLQQLLPVIQAAMTWASENPELIAQLGLVAGAAAVLGPVLIGLGTVVSALGAAIAFIASPIGIAVAAVAALALAYQTNFLGIRDFIDGEILPRLRQFFGWLGAVWETTVQPGLQALYTWFTETALPAVVGFVQTNVAPVLEAFFGFLGDVWTLVGPALDDLYTWFTQTALPAVVGFVEGPVMTAITQFRDLLVGLWSAAGPALAELVAWFRDTFQYIGDRYIQPVIDFINRVISTVNTAISRVAELLGIGGGGSVTLNVSGGGAAGFRDSGGPGAAGLPYLIGATQQGHEVFVPASNGEFIPNLDREIGAAVERHLGGGGMTFQAGSVVIYANSAAEGRAAADAFSQRLDEERRRRG